MLQAGQAARPGADAPGLAPQLDPSSDPVVSCEVTIVFGNFKRIKDRGVRARRGHVFANRRCNPFTANGVRVRCGQGVGHGQARPIGFHEARHSYASHLIASGANAKEITVWMGHSSVTVTFDRYGHLMSRPLDQAQPATGVKRTRPSKPSTRVRFPSPASPLVTRFPALLRGVSATLGAAAWSPPAATDVPSREQLVAGGQVDALAGLAAFR
jgi:hypothetical protein